MAENGHPTDRSRFKDRNIVRGMSRSMRNVGQLEEEYKKKKHNLTRDEERLLDLVTFKKTGKHIGPYKDQGKPNKPEVPVLDTGGSGTTKEEARAKAKKAVKGSENVS